ncbi:MAG: DUF4197 domain-containing protein [Burkholderiales bacterium]|jgi:hypothetical protein|uniref:DUF4197 domain-containing protein n=1 Tax=Arenimonas sp. TaxID=1872635 RepID=UPI003C0D5DA4
MLRILGFLLSFVIGSSVIALPAAAGVADLSNADAVSGLKQALTDGSAAAVKMLGQDNGYFGNAKVKIPLPPNLQKIESGLRVMGMKKQADELVLSMNRAAEAAAPEAKQLLVDAVKKMSVQDAKAILTGGDTAATDYFRRTTQEQLTQRFLPIVKKSTDRVGLAQQYNSFAGQGASLGLVKKDDATIETYVTRKALDGLYLMIAEQEKAFRQNPVGATSDIVKKVFGALR